MNTVFINFRAGDAQDTAVLIDRKLCRVFGADNVFRSSRTIPKGVAFDPVLIEAVTGCSVFLAVIGPNWLSVEHEGRRRIDAPADWVRTEIELAIAGGKPVIPVLVGDRAMPAAAELPATITDLARRQYLRIHHRSAEYDLRHLVDSVREHLGPSVPPRMADAPESALVATLESMGRTSDVRFGPVRIDNRLFSDSIIHRSDLFAQSPRGSVSFNLGRSYRRFESTVGVLDNAVDAGQVGVFQVFLDGQPGPEVTATLGRSRVLRADVTDVLRLELRSYRPGTTESPLLAGARMAGGLSNHLPELGWGNPVVHS
ncbi:TIR domain-containing protein [Amycolatopsis australiensis]|uniref:NPCBM/NEW2 domain-containing protein n=1 Tax=Amycolatopsis australiensis TaxID=546364 RepID=A0A1K1SZ63_9PSEU|nr:TIR domain-containing protein [Amycolatopsis australiensis]SFW89587.1 NPCBM/NEW2 domain-containing protein [Amycolatopsis australiensis]